jgi:hypothetical protein
MTDPIKWPAVTTGTLTPAYGRDYDTPEQVQEAFLAGKDFLWNHPLGSTYCSVRDFQPGDTAKIRYNHKEAVTFCQVPEETRATDVAY